MFQEMMPMSNGGGSEPIEYRYRFTGHFATPGGGTCTTGTDDKYILGFVAGTTSPTHVYQFIIDQDGFTYTSSASATDGTRIDFNSSGYAGVGSMSVQKNADGTGFTFNDSYSGQRGWNSAIIY